MAVETRTRTVRFVGRCKACKAGHAHEISETVETTRTISRSVAFGEREIVSSVYHVDGRRVSGRSTEMAVAAPCGHRVALRRVKGSVSAHVCNDKCMSSTGPTCECSCGGKNHGAGHMIAAAA